MDESARLNDKARVEYGIERLVWIYRAQMNSDVSRPSEKSSTTIFWSCEVLYNVGLILRTSSQQEGTKFEDSPHNATVVKFDVEDMADMAPTEFTYHATCAKVPYFDCFVVAPAHEAAIPWVKRQRTHK